MIGPTGQYDTPLTYVPIAQGAAGTTQLMAATAGKRSKLMGLLITISVTGTVKFIDGAGDLTGAMNLVAGTPLFVPAGAFPIAQGAINSALSLVSTTGAVQGVAAILVE